MAGQDHHTGERVASGAALLDEAKPGWVDEIDLDGLRIASCYSCVLGQLYGSFYVGTVEVGLGLGDVIGHGFNADLVRGERYADLDAEWKQLIRDRRGEG